MGDALLLPRDAIIAYIQLSPELRLSNRGMYIGTWIEL
jgi:hypothetical protein